VSNPKTFTIMNVISFLKKHNLYEKALQYNQKSYGFENEDKAKEYFKYYQDSPTLKGFFEFHKTVEGSDFWFNLDKKFKHLNNKTIYEKAAY
jgi:hypothetical protein